MLSTTKYCSDFTFDNDLVLGKLFDKAERNLNFIRLLLNNNYNRNCSILSSFLEEYNSLLTLYTESYLSKTYILFNNAGVK